MKKRIINIILGLLLSITSILVLYCFTLLNKNYVIHVFDKYNLYKEIDINKKEVKKYIKSNYSYEIKSNSFKKYIDKRNIKKIKTVSYIVTIASIIITGELFLHTKKIHDLNKVMLTSSVILLICCGLFRILYSNNNYIIYKLMEVYYKYLLAYSIIIIEVIIFKKIYKRFYKGV